VGSTRFSKNDNRASEAAKKQKRGPALSTIVNDVMQLQIGLNDDTTHLLKKYRVRPKERTILKAILLVMAEKAMKGDIQATKLLLESEFGRPAQALDIEMTPPAPMVVDPEELKTMIENALSKELR